MHTPDEGEFDFSLVLAGPAEATYSHEKIMDATVWAMIDQKWEGNWRQDSQPGPDFSFPKSGYHNGRWYEATLIATFENFYIQEGEGEEAVETFKVERTATLVVEEAADLVAAASTLDLVEAVGSEVAKKAVEELRANPDAPEYQLRIKEGVSYHINTAGVFTINQYRSLQDLDGDELWSSLDPPQDEEEEEIDADAKWLEEEHQPSLVEADIENLIIAAEVLGADPDILAYLRTIKIDPTEQ